MIKEDGTVVFEGKEQDEVNRIVQDRLSREKEKYTEYEDLKGLDEELKALGYEGTAKERREFLKNQREEIQRQKELQELQEQAKQEGTSPELKKEIKELNAKIARLEKANEDKIKEAKEQDEKIKAFEANVSEFEEAYPDVDLDKLNKDEEFIEFLKDSNPSLSLVKVYERYVKYTHTATDKAVAKIQSNLERSTSSGKSKGTNESYGLTASQRETVDEWNRRNPKMKLTYQEFAQSLRK